MRKAARRPRLLRTVPTTVNLPPAATGDGAISAVRTESFGPPAAEADEKLAKVPITHAAERASARARLELADSIQES